ncbi:MAG: zf-HC2 domain-containing protein [Planctomycetota bacterium]|nr:zf-HC2 domain-containing protein [Planctomycetota bacterium]
MTCDECRDRLQDLVDGEVSGAEKAALDSHLGACPDCAELHKRLAKFTTTMVKTVKPLRPSGDFTSRVMARFEESKADLARTPSQKAIRDMPATPSWPVWPFAAAIGILVLVGLLLLFRSGPPALGRIVKGADAAKVQRFENGAWTETPGGEALFSGNRILATESPGTVVALDLGPENTVKVFLRSPCAVHLERRGSQFLFVPMAEAKGRLRIRTLGAGAHADDTVRVNLGEAWVEVKVGQKNEVDVAPDETNHLVVSVKLGSAKIGNVSETEQIAEGYARTVPQKGACSAATQAKSDAFGWLEGP